MVISFFLNGKYLYSSIATFFTFKKLEKNRIIRKVMFLFIFIQLGISMIVKTLNKY